MRNDWPSIGSDNLPEMERLRRRYLKFFNRKNPRGMMTS